MWSEHLNVRGYLKCVGVSGRIILEYILKFVQWCGMILLFYDREQWQACVNAVWNLGWHNRQGIFSTSWVT